MNLLRKNPLLAAGAVCAVILLIEVVLLIVSRIDLSRKTGELARSSQQLSRLQSRKPFPSLENIRVLEANLDTLEFHSGELQAELQRDPFQQASREASDFSARTQDVIERFKKRAVESGVKVPDSLEVGFAEYASRGAVPDAKHVPRLSRQLYSVERVVEVLVRSGVDSVDSLTRDNFETEPPASLPLSDRRRSSRRSIGPALAGNPSLLIASKVHPANLYYVERIGVSFTADEEVVWRVLHLFASAPHAMAISEFSHATKSDILQYSPEEIKRAGEADDDTLRYLAEGILVGEKALSRSERIVSGNEVIQVHLVVDVFNFNPEAGRR